MDVPRDPLRGLVDSLHYLQVHRPGGPFRVGVSRIGSSDYFVDEDEGALVEELMNHLFPGSASFGKRQSQRVADVDHLLAHRRSGADWFITSEKAILAQSGYLAQRVGIRATSCRGFLESLGVSRHTASASRPLD